MNRITVYQLLIFSGLAILIITATQPGKTPLYPNQPTPPATPLKPPYFLKWKTPVLPSVSHADDYPTVVRLANDSVNSYLRSVHRNESYFFNWIVWAVNDAESPADYLEHEIIGFRTQGINVLVAGFQRNQLSPENLQYVSSNGMVLFSPAFTVDRDLDGSGNGYNGFVSLVTNATSRANSISELLIGSNLKAAIVIDSSDVDSKSVLTEFTRLFREKGGVAIPVSASISVNDLESLVRETSKVYTSEGTFIVGYNTTSLLREIRGKPSLSNSTWFDFISSALPSDLSSYGGGFRVMTARPTFLDSGTWKTISERFSEVTGHPMDEVEASTFDAMNLLVRAYSHSTVFLSSPPFAETILYSKGYIGLTGDCSLNARGDRDHLDYELISVR